MAGAPRALHMHEPCRTCGAMQRGPALTGSHFINSLSSSCSFKRSIIANKAVTLCLQLYNLAECRGDLGCEDGAAAVPARGPGRVSAGSVANHEWVWSNHVSSAAPVQQPALVPSPVVFNREKTRGHVAVPRVCHVWVLAAWPCRVPACVTSVAIRKAPAPCSGKSGALLSLLGLSREPRGLWGPSPALGQHRERGQ